MDNTNNNNNKDDSPPESLAHISPERRAELLAELAEKEDHEVVVLRSCSHGFCAACLMKWQRGPVPLSSSNCCPLCRVDVEDVEEQLIQRVQICVGLLQQRGLADPLSEILADW